jgi:hypothetical protein
MRDSAVNPAICPSCANPMRFARSLPQARGLSELQIFECRTCGLAVSGEAVAEVLEMTTLSVVAPISRDCCTK